MIFAIANLIIKIFGFDDIKATRIARWVFIVLLLAVLIAVGLFLRSCLSHKPKLDEKQIQKAEQAIKTRNDEKLKEVLAEADTRDDNIDATIKQAEQNTANAKKKYDNLSTDELQKELESRK